MKPAHPYKRRTYDEARVLAMAAAREQILSQLPPDTIEEMRGVAIESGGSVLNGWESIVGTEPDCRMHYEFQVYQPSDQHPYVAKYYFRALVSRDRLIDRVWFMWLPAVPDYPVLSSPPH